MCDTFMTHLRVDGYKKLYRVDRCFITGAFTFARSMLTQKRWLGIACQHEHGREAAVSSLYAAENEQRA